MFDISPIKCTGTVVLCGAVTALVGSITLAISDNAVDLPIALIIGLSASCTIPIGAALGNQGDTTRMSTFAHY